MTNLHNNVIKKILFFLFTYVANLKSVGALVLNIKAHLVGGRIIIKIIGNRTITRGFLTHGHETLIKNITITIGFLDRARNPNKKHNDYNRVSTELETLIIKNITITIGFRPIGLETLIIIRRINIAAEQQ